MKVVLVLLAVFALLWLLRGAASRRTRGGSAKPPAAASPQAVVACAQCGVHLPLNEALPGKGGVFCGDAHRAQFEKERAAPP